MKRSDIGMQREERMHTFVTRATLVVLIFLVVLTVYSAIPAKQPTPWQNRLFTPTQLAILQGKYFLVDCWHHRVLWSDELTRDLSEWKVISDQVIGPHSIASDGEIFLVDDTESSAVVAYRFKNGAFFEVQRFTNLGVRPHRVRYDQESEAFWVVMSKSQEIAKITRTDGRYEVSYTKHLPFLEGKYTRSFTIHEDLMYFVSGPDAVIGVRYLDDSFEEEERYPVPPELGSMNDLFFSGEYWYLSATPQKLIRVRELQAIGDPEQYEDLFEKLQLRGTPYYFTAAHGRIYLPEITEYSRIISFVENGAEIADLQIHFDFGPPNRSSLERKAEGFQKRLFSRQPKPPQE
ncbi:hypothetical protein MRY87_13360 [bacterium]|nr:hypothetical protein [bacterium]